MNVSGVFISYRQDDSKPWAVMLRDALAAAFGDEHVFLDKDALHAGDWRDQLHAALNSTRVVIVVIGRRWLSATDAAGQPRLWNPDDVHRQEVAAALARPDMTVIPVCVDQAPLPRPDDLPPDIRALLNHQSREISDSKRRRDVDVQLLIEDIEHATGMSARRRQAWFPAGLGVRARVAAVTLLAVVALAAGWSAWSVLHDERPATAVDVGLRADTPVPPAAGSDAATVSNSTASDNSTTSQHVPSSAPARSPRVVAAALPTSVQTQTNWGERQMAEDLVAADRQVTYSATLERGLSKITFDLPYLARLSNGGTIEGLNYLGTPFKWRFPELSIRAVNNTSGTMVLSEARLEVITSRIITTPVITVEDLSVDKLVFRNEGWGDVVNPSVTLTITDANADGTVSLFAPASHTVTIPTFSETGNIPLNEYVPERMRLATLVVVDGTLEYGDAGHRRSVMFKTRVSRQVRAAVGIPPSHFYDVVLKAGEAGIVRQVPLAQEIAAGGSDHFVIRLGADKSSTQRLRISFRTVDGKIFDGGQMDVDIFVPRSSGKILQARQPR